jgi:hypothetical protein
MKLNYLKKWVCASLCAVAFLAFTGTEVRAQVTIGDNKAPEPFSVLQLDNINHGKTGLGKGLRLPYMSDVERDIYTKAIEEKETDKGDLSQFDGLMIYNTTSGCIEYWGGTEKDGNKRWVSLCAGTLRALLKYDDQDYGGYNTWDANGNQLDENGTPLPGEPGPFVPDIHPECTGLGGTEEMPYTIYISTGNTYADLKFTDETTGKFTLQFSQNNSANKRLAVVHVINNCTGEFKDFPFIQEGGICGKEIPVHVQIFPAIDKDTNGKTPLCSNGAIYCYIDPIDTYPGKDPLTGDPADLDVNYIWTKSGTVINTGTSYQLTYQITATGKYEVYPFLVGCTIPAVFDIIPCSNCDPAPLAPRVLVENDGILCGEYGTVKLSAIGLNGHASSEIHWFHNGILYTTDTGASITLKGAQSAGEWFAVISDGTTCASLPSNTVRLDYVESDSHIDPPVPLINDETIENAIICGGGTLKLSLDNISDYTNPTLKWFINGQLVGETVARDLYVPAPKVDQMIISLTVTIPGECPISISTDNMNVSDKPVPPVTSINRGADAAYICGTNAAILMPGAQVNDGSVEYEWFRDGLPLGPAQTNPDYAATLPGKYKLRYRIVADGCWSNFSTEINVQQSAPLNLQWVVAPKANTASEPVANVTEYTGDGVYGTEQVYSVSAAPNPKSYTWSATATDVDGHDIPYETLAAITQMGDGSMAMVKYKTGPDNTCLGTLKITVWATNDCGEVSLPMEGDIKVRSNCAALTSVNISPDTPQTIQEGEVLSFTAYGYGGTPVSYYDWYVDGIQITGDQSENPSLMPSVQSYLLKKGKGDYEVYCVVHNGCTNGGYGMATKKVTVKVKPSLASMGKAPDSVNPYFSGQKTCLDVRQTAGNPFVQNTTIPDDQNPWKVGRLPLNVRPDDFRNTRVFTYNFAGTNINISSLDYRLEDPEGVVKSLSGNGTGAVTLTFIDDIVSRATGRLKDQAFKVMLYATFELTGDATKTYYKEPISITIQDGACGCPALVAPNKYKMDYCFAAGAGADDDLPEHLMGQYIGNPFEFVNTTYGAYYKWGCKYPTSTYNKHINTSARATTPSTATGAWPAANNPCPYGWKPLIGAEMNFFDGVTSNRANNAVYTNTNGQNGQLRGMVPVAGGGYRIVTGNGSVPGAIVEANNCHTWNDATSGTMANNKYFYSSTVATTAILGLNYSKGYGEHVRCIQEGESYGADGY